MAIRLIIFDLDGVLINTRSIHFNVLNQALAEEHPQFIISEQDHLSRFDGLSTMRKLDVLEKERGLSPYRKNAVWMRKQELTIPALVESIQPDEKLISIIRKLKDDGIKVWVASNAINESVKVSIKQLGIHSLIDGYLSNEDVSLSKPFPEIYWNIMTREKIPPSETLIVEDSYVGRNAATASPNICPVNNKNDVTMERIYNHINKETKGMKWHNDKMNIVIPMAGAGSRFAEAGYTFPKPLIEVNGKPMIQMVVDNLNIEANFIYIVRKEHYDQYHLHSLLNMLTPNCKIVIVDQVTEGAACTTLLAKQYIDNDNPLLIANSDQYVEWTSGEFYHSLNSDSVDGSILTFENLHPKWSYVKTDEYGNVTEVAEKTVISNQATVGIYYYSKGNDYVKYADQMIAANDRFNNEFYVSKIYNYAIADGKRIKVYPVKKMHGLGDPDSLKQYLEQHK